ncbi:ATP-dependent RNA helicase dbp2 [Elysia marginata]|uniref:RNA helicase n=1 Tax=Elysia marginata TaxID=1093978 RepID=A0AAV4EGW6_9GAST|nr:ATP-dependent RNA helicase dbp2 [Elysia marginata]
MDSRFKDVRILEVRSPWDFLVVEDPEAEASSNTNQFAHLMESMNDHLNSLMEQGNMAQRPKEGEICAVLRREDNRWHRVRVDSWLERNKGQYACCYLIDKGCQEIAPVQRLMKLSAKYTELPSKVLHCSLWGIQPLSLRVEQSYTGLKVENRPSEKWDSSASQYMTKTFDNDRVFQANDNFSPRFSEVKPTVAKFFNKYISSPEKFPPLPPSSTSSKTGSIADTVDQQQCDKVSSDTEFSCTPLQSPPGSMECHMNSPFKSSSTTFSPPQTTAIQLIPSRSLSRSSLQAPSVQNILHGRGRALLASYLEKRPGLPKTKITLSSSKVSEQMPRDNDLFLKEPIPTDISSNGQFMNHTDSHESETEAVQVPNTMLPSEPSNLSRSNVNSVSVQKEQRKDPSVANLKLSDGNESATSPSSGTRARFRKSGDAFLEKKSPMRNKETKPTSANILNFLKASAPDFRDNAVRQARGQAQGRQFLEELRQSSGHTERYPTITRPDQPVPRPMFGVLVHGKSPPALTCDVEDVPFEERVKQILEHNLEITTARSIQGFVWPAALACRHVIGVCPPEKGKTTAYIPAVLSLLSDTTMYIELPKGKGPLALVIVPTWKKARDVFEMIELFTAYEKTELKRVRPIVLYAGGTEETESTQTSLIKGCEILIATPASLLRILELELTSFQRLCHMILDDADILGTRFADQIDQIMQQFRLVFKNRRHQVVPCQIMMFASRWTDKLNEFRLRYTWEPIVVISSRVEASVYGGVKQVVTMSRWEQRLSTFCSLLDTMVPTDKRVAAFTSDVEEAVEMWKGAKSRGVYCLLIHHELPVETVTEAREQWLHSSHTKQLIVIVCTDQCYQDLAITNATDVIHYGLPDSKTKFGNRLACMFDFFKDRTTNEEHQPESEAEGVSHVILTDRCAPRAEQLNEILQRCPSQHPPQLREFLRGYKVGVENDERKMLCPLLKAFGTCIAHNHQENCKNRHLVISKQDLKTGEIDGNSLPASGQVTIKIIRVVTAGRFYCHLVGHRAVGSPASQDMRLTYFKLAMDMTAFYSKISNHVPYLPSEDLFHDGLCAFKDEEGAFFRAKVLETQEGPRSAPMTQCKVWLVDMGCYKCGTIDQLLALPRRMAEVPYQAIEVYLCCLKPIDDDKEWTDKVNIFVHNLVEGKELVGRIMLSAGLTLWLMPLVHQVTLKNVGVTSDISLRFELLQNKFAVANPDHMKMLYELYRGKTEIPETLMSQYFEYCLEIELTQEMLSTDQNDFHKVKIAAVISPTIFYLHTEGAVEKLEKLEVEIENAVLEFDEAADRGEKIDAGMTLEQGSVCLALSTDARWYRAKLVSDCVDNKWEVVASKESDYSMGMKLVVDLYETQREEIRFSHELVKRHKAKAVDDRDQEQSSLKPLIGKPALKNQRFFNHLDKVKFLAANLYWAEDEVEAMKQAAELEKLLSFRMRGWDTHLHQREVLSSVVNVVGYISNLEAHGVMLRSLAKCCVESQLLCEDSLEHGLLERLSCCLEQKSHTEIQTQAAGALACLVGSESFREECLETLTMSLTLNQVLSSHTPESPVSLQVLKHLCSTASRLIHDTQESLPSLCSMDAVIQALEEATEDNDREPWLELLSAMASKECTHSYLMRQANIKIVLELFETCFCAKCLYYCLKVCLSIAEASRKHKKVLLENKLLITLNRLSESGIASPAREICQQLKSAMTLHMPAPEVLSGTPAQNNNSVDKVRCPEVLWSQNCFRVVLKVKVRNAQRDNFRIGPKRICCRVHSDNTLYELDWELYDTILPDRSKIDVQPTKTVISLKKVTQGQWKRLCKQKVFSLKPDMDNLYNSDSDVEEVEDDQNLSKLTEKRKVIWRDGSGHVNQTPRFDSSDDTSDDPAIYSNSDLDEPKINMDFLLKDQ